MRLSRSAVFKIVIVTALFIGSLGLLQAQEFAGGSGTEADPWQIATAEHLSNVRNYLGEEHSNKHFIQIADIDLGVAPWNQGEGWIPITICSTNRFTGNYDGNHHIISNLFINRPQLRRQSLFGNIWGATIKNLAVVNVNVRGAEWVGGLVGEATHDSKIMNSYATGNVRGTTHVGLLVGTFWNTGSMVNCYSDGNVTGTDQVGGLVGQSGHTTVKNCYSRANVTGLTRVGGLVGRNAQSTRPSPIYNSFSTGRVQGNTDVGGLVGYNNCIILNSYWDTQTSGTDTSAGGEGAMGRSTAQMTYPYAENTFVDWDFDDIWVTDESLLRNDGYPFLVWQSFYAFFDLIAVQGDGFVDLSWNEPENLNIIRYRVYRNNEMAIEVDAEQTDYRDNNVENYTEYEYFVTAMTDDERETQPSNVVYATPHEPFQGGNGSEQNPFKVATAQHIYNLRYYFNEHHRNKHFQQINNIDLGVAPYNEGEGWEPIGNTQDQFVCNYRGNGFAIENLFINRPNDDNVGLFGYINNSVCPLSM